MFDPIHHLAILITAYKQFELTKGNIIRFRYKHKHLKDAPIIVVTTAGPGNQFWELERDIHNVHVIDYQNCPFNPNSTLTNSVDKKWGFQIVPRVLLSIREGIIFAHDILKKHYLWHLHSDVYWKPEKQESLIHRISSLPHYAVLFDYYKGLADTRIPSIDWRLMWHPENLFLNLDVCKTYNYLFGVDNIIFGHTKFNTDVWSCMESMLGEMAVFCFTGRNWLDWDEEVPEHFKAITKACDNRPWHGEFESGLVCLSEQQEGRHNSIE